MARLFQNQDICELDLDGGLFAAFESPTENKRCGVYWLASECNNVQYQKQLPAWKNLRVKLIGSKSAMDAFLPLAATKGLLIEKQVERSAGKVVYRALLGKILLEKANANVIKKKQRLVIVDDSQTIRRLLMSIFAKEADFEIVGDFADPLEALKKIPELRPDVITLDIHMPSINGIEFLKRLMPVHKIPVVMISSISMEDGNHVLNALEAGAVDYIQKPSFDQLATVTPVIVEKVRNAAGANITATGKRQGRETTRPIITRALPSAVSQFIHVIAIGSSTGGTEALREVLCSLPEGLPPIVIVQHIPPVFSKAFADRINQICEMEVKEATDLELLKTGHVYIAPGGKQMKLKHTTTGELQISVFDGEPVNRHKPSVDVLFHSVAELVGKRAVGMILTGMGADGAKGLLAMKQRGAHTLGQDEKSCIVYGMPKAAKALGAVNQELPLEEIPLALINLLERKAA